LAPKPIESRVCIIRRGKNGDSAETLEPIAAKLAEATQIIGVTEMEANSRLIRICEFLFAPMIVTSARLVVARFDPKEVNLQRGMIPGDKVTSEIGVPFVGFRKPLSCARAGPGEGLSDINDDLQRTVFVVNSMHVGAFLNELNRDAKA
jgi:hypothetical protein